ncbi:MAG: M23 family metallopeptidase [Clostridia bacterium]|nr:M23 family metallopeptidase [Clostridia bacterium]
MLGSFFKQIYSITVIIVVFTIIISVFFIPSFYNQFYSQELLEQYESLEITISSSGFAWPIPGYTRITSPYGKRVSPTAGASNFHKGIDIGAPEGTILIAAIDGKITYLGFLGGGGYTITLSNDDMKITYCHVSPNYLVEVGQEIKRGQIIGLVGPKNVYGVPGNNYKDENGNPTNGATTGCHLHFGVRINEQYTNPLDYF